MARTVEHQPAKINEDQNVNGEQADPDPGKAPKYFENLPGQKGSGDREGQKFAPGFLEIKTDSFRHRDSGIGERDEADAAQGRVIEQGTFFQDEVDETRLGIEVKMVGKHDDLVGDVLVKKTPCADADNDEEERMQEFVKGDEEQPTVVALAARSGL
ncbi:MAG TPA: hypothetical protein VIY69_13515 [Candidatus Acidoferrales bacterium]